jgi:hypothetical protein
VRTLSGRPSPGVSSLAGVAAAGRPFSASLTLEAAA